MVAVVVAAGSEDSAVLVAEVGSAVAARGGVSDFLVRFFVAEPALSEANVRLRMTIVLRFPRTRWQTNGEDDAG